MHYVILFMARYAILIVVLAVAVYWLTLTKPDKIRFLVFGTIAGLISLLLVTVGGAVFYDPRPFLSPGVVPIYLYPADNGFPSDHTALALVLAATVWLISKRFGIGLFVVALAIGLSRVMGNLHSPIDILGSLVFVGLAVTVAYLLTPKVTGKIKV